MGDLMTYPTRQWDAEQQDAIAHYQWLRALKELRKNFLMAAVGVIAADAVASNQSPISTEKNQ